MSSSSKLERASVRALPRNERLARVTIWTLHMFDSFLFALLVRPGNFFNNTASGFLPVSQSDGQGELVFHSRTSLFVMAVVGGGPIGCPICNFSFCEGDDERLRLHESDHYLSQATQHIFPHTCKHQHRADHHPPSPLSTSRIKAKRAFTGCSRGGRWPVMFVLVILSSSPSVHH